MANLNAAIESAQRKSTDHSCLYCANKLHFQGAGAIRETSDLESSSRAYELDDDEDVELFESRYEDSQDVILVDPFDKVRIRFKDSFNTMGWNGRSALGLEDSRAS